MKTPSFRGAACLALLCLACATHVQARDHGIVLPEIPKLTDEEKALPTEDLFWELVAISGWPISRRNEPEALRLEYAIPRELGIRDRESHEWFASLVATTEERLVSEHALSSLLNSYLDEKHRWKAKYPDIARSALLMAIDRSLRKEQGSADRSLLVAYLFVVGEPGDFPLIEPFLETSGDSLTPRIVDLTARVIGTKQDLPSLRFHAERFQRIADHAPPNLSSVKNNTAMFAKKSIGLLEQRLAEEAAAVDTLASTESEPDYAVGNVTEDDGPPQLGTEGSPGEPGASRSVSVALIALGALLALSILVGFWRRRNH